MSDATADQQPVDPITAALRAVHREASFDHSGTIADYIPELATADPSLTGLALSTIDGRLYTVGDVDVAFTIQSVSKPFVYAMVLAELGLEATLDRVGAEPSGEAFNAISLEPETGRPANPMVNAGAIVTTSLVRAADPAERFERILDVLSAFAGRRLDVDERVFESERATGDRNRALAYLMRAAGALEADVVATVDVYFRQCAVQVTARDLAIMGATLSNGGTNPITGRAVVDADIAERVLTVMATCGMYDASGEWLLRVGLPAKSGVAGGLMAVSPAEFGMGMFSPLLDERGNSVRAVAMSRALVDRFSLHLMHQPARTAPVISAEPAEANPSVTVITLQGDIEFAASELVLREIAAVGRTTSSKQIVLDLHRVTRVHRSAIALFDALGDSVRDAGGRVVIVDPERRHLVSRPTPEFGSLTEALQHFAE